MKVHTNSHHSFGRTSLPSKPSLKSKSSSIVPICPKSMLHHRATVCHTLFTSTHLNKAWLTDSTSFAHLGHKSECISMPILSSTSRHGILPRRTLQIKIPTFFGITLDHLVSDPFPIVAAIFSSINVFNPHKENSPPTPNNHFGLSMVVGFGLYTCNKSRRS